MLRNGDVNRKLGVYRSVCCDAEIVLDEGSVFPDCPNHPKLTTEWKPLVDPNEEIPRAASLGKKDPAA